MMVFPALVRDEIPDGSTAENTTCCFVSRPSNAYFAPHALFFVSFYDMSDNSMPVTLTAFRSLCLSLCVCVYVSVSVPVLGVTVADILRGTRSPKEGLEDLMTMPLKAEMYDA